MNEACIGRRKKKKKKKKRGGRRRRGKRRRKEKTGVQVFYSDIKCGRRSFVL